MPVCSLVCQHEHQTKSLIYRPEGLPISFEGLFEVDGALYAEYRSRMSEIIEAATKRP